MASDDFLESDVSDDDDDRRYPQAPDVDEELPEREAERERGAIALEEHIGLTPPD
jgi:hypothetical protein